MAAARRGVDDLTAGYALCLRRVVQIGSEGAGLVGTPVNPLIVAHVAVDGHDA